MGVMKSSPKQKALAFKSSPYFSGYKDIEGLLKIILRKIIVLKRFNGEKNNSVCSLTFAKSHVLNNGS